MVIKTLGPGPGRVSLLDVRIIRREILINITSHAGVPVIRGGNVDRVMAGVITLHEDHADILTSPEYLVSGYGHNRIRLKILIDMHFADRSQRYRQALYFNNKSVIF